MVCVDIGQTASRSLIVYHQGPATNRSNTPSITEQLGTLHNYWTVGDSPQVLNSWGLSKITEQLGILYSYWTGGNLHNYWTVGDSPKLLNSRGLPTITEPGGLSTITEQLGLSPPTGAIRPQLMSSQVHSTVTKQLGTYTPQCWTVGDSTYSVQPPIGVRDTPKLLKSLAFSTLLNCWRLSLWCPATTRSKMLIIALYNYWAVRNFRQYSRQQKQKSSIRIRIIIAIEHSILRQTGMKERKYPHYIALVIIILQYFQQS
jgi:hypothetical protein